MQRVERPPVLRHRPGRHRGARSDVRTNTVRVREWVVVTINLRSSGTRRCEQARLDCGVTISTARARRRSLNLSRKVVSKCAQQVAGVLSTRAAH
ncbi:hypothetical protein ABZ863_11140 [Saccharomonospora sp. NPDC046836]|uniref:hypothetical protein n=1 Tax=Saccharomonospora sp. NPDC046836 TaxID=3156921 RepID=UPI00340C231D